jgi:hypothetical protein
MGKSPFRTRVAREARPRQVKTLLKQGWTKMGGYWLSPYSNLCYPESIAIDVESLRGTFSKEWIKNAKARRLAAVDK